MLLRWLYSALSNQYHELNLRHSFNSVVNVVNLDQYIVLTQGPVTYRLAQELGVQHLISGMDAHAAIDLEEYDCLGLITPDCH